MARSRQARQASRQENKTARQETKAAKRIAKFNSRPSTLRKEARQDKREMRRDNRFARKIEKKQVNAENRLNKFQAKEDLKMERTAAIADFSMSEGTQFGVAAIGQGIGNLITQGGHGQSSQPSISNDYMGSGGNMDVERLDAIESASNPAKSDKKPSSMILIAVAAVVAFMLFKK